MSVRLEFAFEVLALAARQLPAERSGGDVIRYAHDRPSRCAPDGVGEYLNVAQELDA
jgi:hypothetical protein